MFNIVVSTLCTLTYKSNPQILLNLFLFFVHKCFACSMYVHHLCSVPIRARREWLIPWNWSLLSVVSHHMGAGSWAQVLFKINECFYLPSHLSGSCSGLVKVAQKEDYYYTNFTEQWGQRTETQGFCCWHHLLDKF